MIEFDENLNPINNLPEPPRPVPSRAEGPAGPSFTPPPPPAPPLSDFAPQPRPNKGGGTLFGLVAIVAIVMLAFVGLNQLRNSGSATNQPEGIVANADSTAYITPDVAKLTFGVSKTAATVAVVEDQLNSAITDVKNALDPFNIKDKDFQTTDFTLYPNQDFRSGVSPRTLSYTGRHMLTLTVRDLNQVDDILVAITNAGVNEINDVSFTVEDMDKTLADARSDAIKKAKEKAKQMASDAGVSLGRLVSITEYSQSPDQYYGLGGKGGGDIAPSVQPGSLQTTVNVTLTYAVS